MKHRKATHRVPICKDFQRKSCEFSSDDCYYTHTKGAQIKMSQEKAQGFILTQPPVQGFWEAPANLASPSPALPKGPTQSELVQIKSMLLQLNQMVNKFQ